MSLEFDSCCAVSSAASMNLAGAVAPALKPTSQVLSGLFLRGRVPRLLR